MKTKSEIVELIQIRNFLQQAIGIKNIVAPNEVRKVDGLIQSLGRQIVKDCLSMELLDVGAPDTTQEDMSKRVAEEKAKIKTKPSPAKKIEKIAE